MGQNTGINNSTLLLKKLWNPTSQNRSELLISNTPTAVSTVTLPAWAAWINIWVRLLLCVFPVASRQSCSLRYFNQVLTWPNLGLWNLIRSQHNLAWLQAMFSPTDTEVPEEHNLEGTTKKLATKRTIKQKDKWQIKEEQYYSILNEGKANTKSCAVRI